MITFDGPKSESNIHLQYKEGQSEVKENLPRLKKKYIV